MTRLKVHFMAEGGVPEAVIAEKCEVGLRSVERILAEPTPTREEVAAGERGGGKRRGRPSKAKDDVVELIRAALDDEPGMMATEVLRRSRAWGYEGSRSAMSALVKRLRPAPKVEPVVRFEGLPGEYAQFDFGHATIRYTSGRRERVVFFAGRLKYSRLMHVVLVPNEQAETLIRGLIACLVVFGGSPKEWVFDNPKTVRISPFGVEPVVLHSYLRDLVAEYRVIPTLCTPGAGNQKGSVERLVGFVKRSFLFARSFADRQDLEAQLGEWLHEVNHERPCDATGVIPAVALKDEAPWLAERPVRCPPERHPLRETTTVTPMGTVSYGGTAYFATAKRIGAPATLFVRKDEIEIVVANDVERSTHARRDHARTVQRLPHQREDMLAAIHGKRKIATFRRQCLLELGRPAWEFLGILVHRCPEGRWEVPCSDLFDLLMAHGDQAMRGAFARCVACERYTVADVRRALAEAA